MPVPGRRAGPCGDPIAPREPEPAQASAPLARSEAAAGAPRIVVVTAHPHLPTPRRLLEAAATLGLHAEAHRPGAPIDVPHAGEWPRARLLVRPGTFSLAAILREQRRLAVAGAQPIQPRRALLDACDQWRTLRRARRAGLPVPASVLVREPRALVRALDAVPGPPWFVKGRRGSQGTQVLLAPDRAAAERAVLLFWGVGASCVVQEDLRRLGSVERHLVVRGRVLSSAIATPASGEFRSNVHRGGRLVALPPGSTPGARLALAAIAAIGLPFGAIDTIGREEPVLLEVNASPGLEALERATGRDLATPLLSALLAVDRPRGTGSRERRCYAARA